MKVGDITSLALLLGGGYLLIKYWPELKGFFGGIAETFSVAGDVLGGAPGTGAPGLSSAVFTGVDIPVVETVEDIPTPGVVHIPSFLDLFLLGTVPPTPMVIPEPDPTAQPPPFWDLINPLVRVPPPTVYTPPATYTPSLAPTYQPPGVPIMESIMPADPGHPATDPFLGGR